jgi:hypothetical protein
MVVKARKFAWMGACCRAGLVLSRPYAFIKTLDNYYMEIIFCTEGNALMWAGIEEIAWGSL